MAEEAVVEKKEEAPVAEVEYTPEESKALANGWKPKTEWGGPEDEWVPARQFNKNGELFGRINSQKNKIQSLEQKVNALAAHNAKVYETGYKDAIDKLKAERRLALREGDPEAVEAIEERIEKVEHERAQAREEAQQIQQQNTEMHPAFEPWLDKNPWYSEPKYRGAADAIAQQYVQSKNGKVQFEDVLEHVESQMRDEFGDKIGSGGKKVVKETSRTSGSERGDGSDGARGRSKARGSKLDEVESNMSDEDRSIMNSLVKSGTLTKEKYLQDLEKINNRKGR